MITQFVRSNLMSLGVISVISLASVGLGGAPANAQIGAESNLEEYETTAPLLGYGNAGATVADVQTFLAEQGYYEGEVDGVYGSETEEAVSEFQADNGLFEDGIIGSQTWEAMTTFEEETEFEAGGEEYEVEQEEGLLGGQETEIEED